MAATAQYSTQTTDGARLYPIDNHGKLRTQAFSFTQVGAGDVASTIDLVDLPMGRVRVLPSLSRISCSAFGAAAALQIGHLAYESRDSGVADPEAADPDAFTADGDHDVSAAVDSIVFSSKLKFDLYSKAGVRVQATLTGAGIPAAATLSGYIAYIYE